MEKKEDQAACNGGEQDVDLVENMDEELAAKEKLTSGETIKFTPISFDGKNGEAKVDLQIPQTSVGMGKEELMKYANDPFWIRLRMFLFVFFWVAWVAMLVGAIVIIILAPRCPPPPRAEWYQKSALYQVDVKTFKDSNDDGVGDLKGVASKLDYFKDINIGTLMLSNFYNSSDEDGIINHFEINKTVGTLSDFEELVMQMKEKGIRLIVDFNPNHSSNKHEWFESSVKRIGPYKDFYVWANHSTEGSDSPPNNWLSVTSESAWTWNADRKQYYLHTYGKDKPDFNLRSEDLKKKLTDILQFWLEKGVDGFNVIGASNLFENANLQDEPIGVATSPTARNYKNIDHAFTVDQPENAGIFAEWRETLNAFSVSTGIQKIFMAEFPDNSQMNSIFYGNETYQLIELPYNSLFTTINGEYSGVDFKHNVEMNTMNITAQHGWPTMLLGKKGISRQASRVGEDLVDAMHMVSVIAKGTPIMYYADELGVVDFFNPANNKISTETVMMWNNDTNAGFSNKSSIDYLIHTRSAEFNVETQEKNAQSHLSIFGRLLALRGQPALSFGIQQYPIVTNETFSLLRVRKGSPGYLVVVNLGTTQQSVDFSGKSRYLPEAARVEIRSGNIVAGPLADGEHPKIPLKHVPLEPKQSVVFSFVPVFKD